MHYLALATDGDGTLLRGGHMGRSTVAALKRWRAAGRKALLVTGETPEDLCEFPHLELFDVAIAENGALLVCCDTRKEMRLGEQPPAKLVRALKQEGIGPLRVGRTIVATGISQQAAVRKVLSGLEIPWQVVLNRKDLMVLPQGVSKSTGLARALAKLGISPRHTVGVGDAENDVALLKFCGLGVAVGNAVPKLLESADFVTRGQYGKGVVELIDRLLTDEASLVAAAGSARNSKKIAG
jgi:HAD superfamily hydrolase (TIGR01484 family)